ncbi:MAG: N-acetylmuramic acid 6-phosphate etherase [Candidatus Hydrogenedentes bacterium]|nr:N-acetylmuramic acid 6-phosphate etherase [Candidatus Hydrogenedentota bacterium]
MTERLVIAIDGGGTGTRVGLYKETGEQVSETTGAAVNPFQVAPSAAADHVASLASLLMRDRPNAQAVVYAGISGAREQNLREIFAQSLCVNVPRVERAVVTTDVHAHLLANLDRRAGALAISGTGSSVAVLDATRQVSLFGGRGPILGDDGSAYHVAVTALRRGLFAKDESGEAPALLKALRRSAELKSAEGFVGWGKLQIAKLAEVVLQRADDGDSFALECVRDCAMSLANLVRAAVRRTQLGPTAPIFVMGGMFEHSFLYWDEFRQQLRKLGVENEVKIAPLIGHRAIFELSRHAHLPESVPQAESTPLSRMSTEPDRLPSHEDDSTPLDWLNTPWIVERMRRADSAAALATHACQTELALLINRIVKAFRYGGRLVYIGAGTSGRIGVLDASECPPTFGVPPGQVIGIIAGGDRALRESVEGAEDDESLGRADIDAIDPPIGKDDVVVGIAASGTTPYTLAAIAAAKARGAATALVYCNPDAKIGESVDHVLLLPTGPEVLPGSTRLKAGTATKMVLNTITTGAMALSGRVFEGYMIGVQPTNTKLRKRAAHIISVLTGIDNEKAAQRLRDAGDSVAAAVLMERLKISAEEAHALLESARGDVRAAIALHSSMKETRD